MQVVLQGSTGDKHSTSGGECSNDLTEKRIHVFYTVCLVDDDVLPGEFLESALFSDTELVRSDENVEFLGENGICDLLRLCGVSITLTRPR